MRCLNCRYSLEGLTGPPHRCPECGKAFDPNDPSTFEHQGSIRFSAALLRHIGIAWVLTCSSVVALGFFAGVDQLSLPELLFGGAFCGSILTLLLLPLLLMMSDLKVRKAQIEFRDEQDD